MSNPIDVKPSKRKNPSYTYVILSVALVLFLLGFFGLLLLHTPKWMKEYKENINVMVEVKKEVTKNEIGQLTTAFEGMPYVKSGSVKYVTKEEVAEEMKEELGTTGSAIGISNPFYDVVNFHVKSKYVQNDSLAIIRQIIMKNDFVKDVFYQESLVDEVNANLRKVGFFALLLGLFFVLIAVVLIHNTIRLAMYSNRFLIKNMQLVGASWNFISRPYLTKGLVNGLWSSGIAIVMLLAVVFMLNSHFPELRLDIWLEDVLSIFVVMSGLIILGVLISYGSTYYVVNKYLKMRLDDLY
ncbi:MAG TPA: hypothetical protein ENJ53_11140 [Phaeodactylibacter sp.]|nr:hypothetical protein [Phaeodactylibacter sp.]